MSELDSIVKFLNEAIHFKEKLQFITDLLNTKVLYEILIDSDYNFFYEKLNLTFDQSFGILFTELTETISTIYLYILKSGVNLTYEYENISNINVGSMLNNDKSELVSLCEILIILILNSKNKENFIDVLLGMNEKIQHDILLIIEKYIVVEEKEDSQSPRQERNENKITLIKKYDDSSNIEEYELKIRVLKEENDELKKEINNYKILVETLEVSVETSDKKIVKLTIENSNLKDEAKGKQKIINDFEKNKKTEKEKEEISEENHKFNGIIFENEKFKKENQELKKRTEALENYKFLYESSKFKIDTYESLKDKLVFYESVANNKDDLLESLRKKEKEIKLKNKEIEELSNKLKELILNKNKDEEYFEYSKEYNEKKKIPKTQIHTRPVKNSNNYVEQAQNNSFDSIKFEFKSENEQKVQIENKITSKFASFKKKTFLECFNKTKENYIEILSNSEELEALSKKSVIEKYVELAEYIQEETDGFEYLKKEYNDIKEKYEQEFELISSCIYSLGVQFLITKQEFNNKIRENPPWLIKQRQRFFNGDI